MKITCPKNSKHKRFSTTAHVIESWEVDENGDFVKVISSDGVSHAPEKGDLFICRDCWVYAKVE